MDAAEGAVKSHFGAADFAVFGGLLLASAAIGVYFAWKDRRDSSTKNYYFGGKSMNPISVGTSLAVTGISAITMIGIPAEVYKVGTVWIWGPFTIALGAAPAIAYYIPLYRRLKLKTAYEYLELRFNPATRRLAAIIVTLHMILLMGIAVYLPALSLSAVSPIPLTWGIIVTSAICTFYTTLGGIKAVIWTDVVQAVVMVAGLVAVFVRGTIIVGGFGELSAALERGERFTWFSEFDISSRMTPASICFGVFFIYSYSLGFTQTAVQRFQSCKTTTQAKYSALVYILPSFLLLLLAVWCGLVMYAYFEGCDPVMSGKLQKMDQGIPYIVLEVFKDAPGMAGMFVAAVYSGSLSTVSSGLNAYSAVLLEDFVAIKWPRLSDKRRLLIGKILALALGVSVMTVALVASNMQSNAIKAFSSFSGATVGPIMGMFILGFFFPWSNSWGAICGALISFGFMNWITVGSLYLKTTKPWVPLPPVSVDMCSFNTTTVTYEVNTTMQANPTEAYATSSIASNRTYQQEIENTGYTVDQFFYNINFHYYKFLGVSVSLISGLLVSFITGHTSPADIDPKLFIPLVDNPALPVRVRKFFRMGVRPLGVGSRRPEKREEDLPMLELENYIQREE